MRQFHMSPSWMGQMTMQEMSKSEYDTCQHGQIRFDPDRKMREILKRHKFQYFIISSMKVTCNSFLNKVGVIL